MTRAAAVPAWRAALAPIGALVLIIAVAPPAYAQAPESERFIQGTWSYSGTLPGNRPMSWFVEWTFADGRFRQSGYPPLHSEGHYRVLQATGDALKLELYEQKGNFSEQNRTIDIAVDRAAGTISVNQGPALRRKPAAQLGPVLLAAAQHTP